MNTALVQRVDRTAQAVTAVRRQHAVNVADISQEPESRTSGDRPAASLQRPNRPVRNAGLTTDASGGGRPARVSPGPSAGMWIPLAGFPCDHMDRHLHRGGCVDWSARRYGTSLGGVIVPEPQLPYGDQAFFMTRRQFLEVGGFPEFRLLEDVKMVALKHVGRTHCACAKPCIFTFFGGFLVQYVLPTCLALMKHHGHVAIAEGEPALTSDRRQHGYFKVTARNSLVMLAYRLGVHPDTLAGWYYSPVSSQSSASDK
ncbi:hypothetical protein Bbelb_341830 [Branchiostoma belcheri]|nr:hypothetical protein Bbelb_341830 [Branchiostoma belcheri]